MTPASAPAPRLATAADADELARLLHDFNVEFDTPSPGPELLAGRLRRLLEGPVTWAVLAPGAGVALLTGRPNVWYEGTVELLDELYVVPDRRGQGIGSGMIALVTATARERGASAIEINVDEGDVDAQRFYGRHGFSSADPDSGERAFYFWQEIDSDAAPSGR